MIEKIIDIAAEFVFIVSAIVFGVIVGTVMAVCMPVAIPITILLSRYKSKTGKVSLTKK
mgnify:CR=1 FL=1|tara:strand:+ start:677 stop:853 length:177 start_codon:yes stop_codon:yes gene_type:complete